MSPILSTSGFWITPFLMVTGTSTSFLLFHMPTVFRMPKPSPASL